MIRFHTLGGLTVTDGEDEVAIGGPRQRRLLAMLLIHRNHVVSVDRLADAVFAGDPTPAASTTLRSYVARARRLVEVPDGPVVVTRAPGYLLEAPDDMVDAARFERALSDGGTNLARDDPQGAVRALRTALDLWRGDAYAEFADEDWARPEAERLAELRLVAHERLVEAELACGHATAVIAEVESLTREHPLREEFRAQLMLALYRAGRHADALRVFRDYRALLVEELGVDPSPALAAIEQRVLTHDPGLLLTEPTGRPLRGYRLGERLGTGRDGTVYAARLPGVDRELAIRVVRAEVADDPAFVRAFESTAQQLAALRHPGIVPIHDYWREPGAAYVVMRRLTGGTLADRVSSGPLPDSDVADLVARVGGALSAAADLGLVHGRVNAESVIYDAAGRPYITDFALAPGGDRSHGDDVHDLAALVGNCLSRPSGRVARLVARGTATVDRPTMADLVTLLVAALTGDLGDPSAPPPNPYKGLRPFEESDAGDFFGRHDLVDRVVERLRGEGVRSRLVLVVGGSGSGKSSVVRAGVLPAVRRGAVPGGSGWFVTTMVPGSSPFKELAECLRSVAIAVPDGLAERLAEDEAGIDRVLRRLVPGGGELLLVVDQLEELFTLGTPADQGAFLSGLLHAVTAPDSRLRVVATLRADFYDRPLAHQPLGSVIDDVTVTTSAMLPAELEAAIVGPADRAGGHVEPALVAELVSSVADQPAALPSLQYTLYELAERSTSRLLELADYRRLGGVGGAIASRAERLWSCLDDTDRDVVRRVFERLVLLSGEGEPTRRRAARTELDALGREQAVETVVDGWVQARLLTLDRDPRTRVPTVEIAHEALLREWPRLRGWIEEDRESIGALDRLREAAATWEELGRDPSALYRGARLELTVDDARLGPADMPPLEQEFLAASVAARDEELRAEEARAERRARDNRRLRVQRAAIAGALVVALVGGFVALDQRQQAEGERRVATARELAAASVTNTESDPERAVLLALAAVDETRAHGEPVLPEAVEALHLAVTTSRVQRRFAGLGGALDWSPDGRFFVTEGVEESGVVDLRDARTGESVVAVRGHRDDVNDVTFSDDGTVLATSGDDGTLRLWDARTLDALQSVSPPSLRVPVRDVSVWSPSFSPDGRLVAASWPDGVRVADVTSGRVVAFIRVEGAAGTAFSPDGRRLAFGASDETMVVDVGRDSRPRRLAADGSRDLAWSPDGRWLATTGDSGVARIFDGDTGEFRFPVPGHTGGIWGLDWSPTGDRLATAGDDGTIRVSTLSALGPRPQLTFSAQETSRGGGFIGVAFSPDGRSVMGGDLGISTVTVWDADPAAGSEWARARGAADFTPDGRHLLVSSNGALRLLDARTGEVVQVVQPPHGQRRYSMPVDVSPDGRRAAVLSGKGVRVLDLATGAQHFVIPWRGHNWANDLAWSPDGSRLAVAYFTDRRRRAVLVVDQSGAVVSRIPEKKGWSPRSLAFSPDGHQLAITRWGNVAIDPTRMPVVLREVDTGERSGTVDASAELVAHDPTGSLIATSRPVDGTVELWNAVGGGLTRTLSATTHVSDLEFDASGQRLATAHADGTVRLWDPESGALLLTLQVSDAVVSTVRFSDDGASLLTLSDDDTARVWALRVDDLVGLANAELTRGPTDDECRRWPSLPECSAA